MAVSKYDHKERFSMMTSVTYVNLECSLGTLGTQLISVDRGLTVENVHYLKLFGVPALMEEYAGSAAFIQWLRSRPSVT